MPRVIRVSNQYPIKILPLRSEIGTKSNKVKGNIKPTLIY